MKYLTVLTSLLTLLTTVSAAAHGVYKLSIAKATDPKLDTLPLKAGVLAGSSRPVGTYSSGLERTYTKFASSLPGQIDWYSLEESDALVDDLILAVVSEGPGIYGLYEVTDPAAQGMDAEMYQAWLLGDITGDFLFWAAETDMGWFVVPDGEAWRVVLAEGTPSGGISIAIALEMVGH